MLSSVYVIPLSLVVLQEVAAFAAMCGDLKPLMDCHLYKLFMPAPAEVSVGSVGPGERLDRSLRCNGPRSPSLFLPLFIEQSLLE